MVNGDDDEEDRDKKKNKVIDDVGEWINGEDFCVSDDLQFTCLFYFYILAQLHDPNLIKYESIIWKCIKLDTFYRCM